MCPRSAAGVVGVSWLAADSLVRIVKGGEADAGAVGALLHSEIRMGRERQKSI